MAIRWKRWIWGVASAAAVSLLLFLLLHTPPAKRLISALITTTVSRLAGADFSIGKLDYRLWSGEVEVESVSYLASVGSARIEVVVPRADVSIAPNFAFKAVVRQPRVLVSLQENEDEEEGTEGTGLDWSFFAFIPPLEVRGGVVEVWEEDAWRIDIADLNAQGDERQDRYSIELTAGSATLSFADGERIVDDLRAEGAVVGTELVVETLRLVSGASTVEAKGSSDVVNPFSGTVDLDVELDASLLRGWLPETEIEGMVSGTGNVAYGEDTFTADGTFDSDSLRWADLEPWTAQGRIALADNELSLADTILRGYGGKVEVEAQMDLGEGATQSFRVRTSDLRTGPLIEDVYPEFPRLSASVGGDASLELRDWGLGEWNASAVVKPEPEGAPGALPIGGTLEALGAGKGVELEADLTSEPLQAELEVRGRVETGRVNVTVEQRFNRLEKTLAWLTNRDFFPEELPDLNGSLRASGKVEGTLDAPTWTATFGAGDLQMGERPYELHALVNGDRYAARIEDLTLRGSPGRFEARGTLPLGERSEWDLDVSLSDMPSSHLVRDLDIDLPGELNGEGQVVGAASDPDWNFALRHRSEDLLADGAGEAELSFRKEKRAVRFSARASSGEASLDGSGSYSLDAEAFDARLALANLSLGGLLSTVTDLEGMAGSLSGELEAHGTLESPGIRANLSIQSGSFREQEIKPIVLGLVSDGASLDLSLDLDGRRLVRGQGRLEDNYPLEVEVDLSRFPFTALVRGLTGLEPDVEMNGKLELDLPLSELEDLEYRAFIEEYRAVVHQEARVAHVMQRASDFTIEGDLRALTIRDFNSLAEGRSLSLEGVIPLKSEESFDFDVAGDFDLSVLAPLLEETELEGGAKLQIKVGGTLSAPEFAGTVEVDANAGRWNVLEWEGIELRARAERKRLLVDRVTLRALGGVLSAQGEVPLRDAEPGRLSFSLQEVDLGRWVAESETGEKPTLVVSAEGDLDLDGLSVDGARGSGRITSVVAGVGNKEVRNSDSVPWRLEQGIFSAERLRLVGGRTELTAEIGPIRFGDEFAWQAWVRGKVDLSILSPFLSSVPGMQIAGNTDLDFRLKDGPDGFVGEGRGTVSGGRFVIPQQPPIVLTDLQGTLALDTTGVRLSDLSARVGDGRVDGEGHIDLTDRSRPVVDIKMRAEGVPLQLAEGLRGRLSGTLQFAGQEDFELSGRVRLDRGIFDRELGEEDRLMSEPMVIYGSATEESFFDRVALAIDVETVSDLHVENSLANLEAGANIVLRGTLEVPVVNGIVVLRNDGRFNVGRNRLNITSGRITFEDYPQQTPRIQLSAFTRVSSTTINLDLDGTMDDIQTRLTAPDDPNLSEGDLTSLLVTGRTLENAAEGGTQVASTWMMSSMANLLHEGWGDLFTFGAPPGAGPLSLGEEANPTSRLTLGRGITDRLSLTYSIALDQTENQLWILDYRLARNFWIQGIQENGNEYTLGFTHRFTIGQKKPEAFDTGTEGRTISGVNYQTELTGKVAELSKEVKTKTGDTYDYWAASEDARRIRDTLVGEGYRSAVVEVGTSPDEEHILLTFKIEAGLPIEIVWEGDDPGNDLKKKIETAWNGRVPIEFLVPDLAARATWELRSKKYYAARVEGKVEPSEGSQRVVFRSELGRQGKQVSLTFDGNQNLADLALIAALPETRTPEFFALLDKTDELAKGVLLRYASEGYLDAAAEIGETSYGPDDNVLNVVIKVDEGPLSRISNLQFDGVAAFSAEELTRAIKVAHGQALDVEAIRTAQTDLRATYRDSGFPDAEVKSRLTRSTEGIEVLFRVDEGARARVGTVRITGTSRVKDSIIQNQLTFREGDTLRVSALNKSMKNLYDSGVFRSADVRVDSESSEEEVKDILVHVAERSGFDTSYGLRYNFVPDGTNEGNLEAKVEGLEGVIRASVANPFGYGSTLGVYAFVQDGRRLVRGYDRFPLFLGRRLPTDLVFEIEDDQSLPGFSLQQWNFTFQQTKRLRGNKFSVQWNVRAGRGHFQGVVGEDSQPFDVNEFRTQLGTSLIFDQRDSMAHPSRGKFWNLTFQVAPEALGSDTAFYRFFGQLFNFHPLFGSVVWASSYRVGLAQGTREVLIIEDRFKAGGANSVRGFAQNALGPTVFVPGVEEEVYIGGQAVFVMNQELRFPIYRSLHGAVFYDMGNVFPRVKDMSFSELRHTAGGGLRYTLSFGALRLDWARILDVQAGEQRSRFHFGFGYAF